MPNHFMPESDLESIETESWRKTEQLNGTPTANNLAFQKIHYLEPRIAKEHFTPTGVAAVSAIDSHVPGVLDSRMTFAYFVECKFIPGHVEYKTRAGQIHYRAMLKHILLPDTVNRIFGIIPKGRVTIQKIQEWPYLDRMPLCDVTTEHIRRITSCATRRGFSSQTVKHIKNVIGAIITHAQKEGCFNGINPASQLRLPPVQHKTRNSMSGKQIGLALEMMEYPERQIALITMYAGLTITDICNLRWKDVNLGLSPIMVEGESILPVSLRIRKQWDKASIGNYRGGRSKTIQIPATILPTLLDLKWRNDHTGPEDYVLVSPNGTRIIPASVRMAKLKPIGEALGISWLSWQDLRRAYRRIASGLVFHASRLPLSPASEFPPALEHINPRSGRSRSGHDDTETIRTVHS